MAPFKIRDEILSVLRTTRQSMLSADWFLHLESQDPATKRAAALSLFRVQSAIRKLENRQLAEIRDALLANEQALRDGQQTLSEALDDLQRVTAVLSAVGAVLNVVGRVVRLLV